MQEFIIDGSKFNTFEAFLDHLNFDVFKKTQIENLEDLDNYLQKLKARPSTIQIVWINAKKSQKKLGVNATLDWYEKRFQRCDPSSIRFLHREVGCLKKGYGKTLFEHIIKILEKHESENLVLVFD